VKRGPCVRPQASEGEGAKYQSGESERTGAISRCGDEMMRTMLYEAAQSMLFHSTKWSWLKAWAMKIAAMVFEFFAFSIQKWNHYTVEMLVPMISHSPVVFWLLPVFGLRGAGYFLATTETIFGVLIFLGYWSPRLGILGALGSIVTYIGTTTNAIPARRLGPGGGWISDLHVADGIPDEGRPVPRCFILFAQAGSGACRAGDKAKCDSRSESMIVVRNNHRIVRG
jgi:Transposase IS116/IS110/IS902 family